MRLACVRVILMVLVVVSLPASARSQRLKLTVRDGDSLRRYQLERGKWVQRGVVDLKPYPTKQQRYFRKLLRTNSGSVWLATDQQLIEVDAAFKAHVRYTAPSGTYIGEFARLPRGHWLVAVGGRVIVLGATFRKLSSLRLLKSDHKSAHDILIRGTTAYILDNIYRPIWAFRVDLRDLKQPTLLQTIDFAGVNVHLSFQWLNAPRKIWSIVRDQSVLGGMSQQVFHYNLGAPQVPRVGVDTLFHYSRRNGRLQKPTLNRRLLSVTPSGDWALVVTYGTGELSLVGLGWRSNRIQVGLRKRVNAPKATWYSQARLATAKSSMVVWVSKRMILWDIVRSKHARQVLSVPWSTPVHALLLSR